MGFRCRRYARLGQLRINFAKGGLSSISVGGRGASFNVPVAGSGGPRPSVGLPGTGLPNSRRLRPGQLDALKQSLFAVLLEQLAGPGCVGRQLWDQGAVSRLLSDGSISGRLAGLLAVIETPEAMEGYLLRAQGQDDAKRRAQRCIEAMQEASRLVTTRGWLS